MEGLGKYTQAPGGFLLSWLGGMDMTGERVGRLYGEMEVGGIMAAEERHE